MKNRAIIVLATLFLTTVVLLSESCKGGKKSSRASNDSTALDSSSSSNLNTDSLAPKSLAPKFEMQSNILVSMHVSGGEAELGSFDIEGKSYEDVNLLDIESNNIKRTVNVKSFYLDETEIANIHWLEYLFYLEKDSTKELYEAALPDTTVWQKELGFNDFFVQGYLRFPGFRFFPIVGVNWMQASDYCIWRTAKVNESPNTSSGSKKSKAKKATSSVVYRLPSEAEWEYAAQAFVDNQFKDANETHRRIYPWDGNTVRNSDKKQLGNFLANFKRGRGDYASILGNRRHDGAIMTNYIWEYPPNDFGLYNMAGNVNEWVNDEYIPYSFEGEELVEDEENGFIDTKSSQNYSKAGFSMYGTVKNRIYKGGSWNDMAFWLAPGTRRFIDQDSATATIGFRCAMSIGDAPQDTASAK